MADDIGTRRPPWLATYRPEGGGFDELVDPEGRIRPVWHDLLGPDLGDAGRLVRAGAEAQRAIRDSGATYTIYGDGAGAERPWTFDPLPLPIAADEWSRLADGLVERAQLLETVLRDLYGPQTLIRRGLLPAPLLHANPGFLRPCHGVVPPRGRWLHLLAVDLVRGADGAWRVLADRAQAPSGLGYALANRGLSERVLPATLRAAGAEPLHGFLQTLATTLADIADRPDPLAVVLTPGPYSETYFEHAYLAGLLGMPLVRGQDLTVRDRRLHLDTLAGPIRVDVVLRRLDDGFADPLELRADSQLGIAGLLQTVRRGGVAIANALGSGLIDGRALASQLPRLARHLLGRPGRLEQIEALWGPDGLADQVELEPERWIVEPAFSDRDRSLLRPAALTAAGRAELKRQLRDEPQAWVGRARTRLSMAPTLVDGAIRPRPIVLRCFVLSQGTDGWTVMPGGLVRYGRRPDEPAVSMQHGGGSKDALVLGAILRAPAPPVALGTPRLRPTVNLPKRVADSLYWFGRYAERAEAAARLGRVALARGADRRWAADLAPLGRALARLGMPLDADQAELGLGAAFVADHDGSFGCAVADLGRLAGDLRDRLAPDLARTVNRLVETAATPATDAAELAVRLDRLVLIASAIGGLVHENMTQLQGWRLLDAGRRLERATQTAQGLVAILAAPDGADLPDGTLDAILSVADSAMTYRWQFGGPPALPAVLELVILDPANPRSVRFQLAALLDHLRSLPGDPARLAAAIRLVDARLARLGTSDLFAAPRAAAVGPRAIAELSALAADLARTSDVLTRHYLGPQLGGAAA